MAKLLLATVAIGAISLSTAAFAAFPGFGQNPQGPEFLITFTDNGISTALNPVYSTDPGPYDGIEDTYFGVVNNSSKTVSSFTLTSTTNQPIGAFDGDGIDTYGAGTNGMDTSGYGGPNAYFTNIASNFASLTVNFITPIAANGGTDIFSLEESVSLSSTVVGTPEASTWAMMLLGLGGLGLAGVRGARRKQMAL